MCGGNERVVNNAFKMQIENNFNTAPIILSEELSLFSFRVYSFNLRTLIPPTVFGILPLLGPAAALAPFHLINPHESNLRKHYLICERELIICVAYIFYIGRRRTFRLHSNLI